MTQEELENYKFCQSEIERLEEQIRIDGDRVTDRIAKIQAADGKVHKCDFDSPVRYIEAFDRYSRCGDDANYADRYKIIGRWCYWFGVSASYDDCTLCETGRFEANRLCMSDEELDAWADERIAEIKEGIEREEAKRKAETARRKEEKRKKELALLKKLQEKYPKECQED